MGTRPDALEAAIAHAWQVFDLPAPATTGVCKGCCMEPEIEADFLKQRARDLPAAYVRDWYFAAFADGLSHDHVAWFLPRVMEMLADGEEVAMVGNEVAFARLRRTGFPDRWPAPEVAAVNQFAVAFLKTMIATKAARPTGALDTALCMFGQGGIDIAPLLGLMDAMTDDDLANLLHDDWFFGDRGRIPFNAFWEAEPARTLAWAWYTSPALAARMDRAAMAGNERALAVFGLIAESQG